MNMETILEPKPLKPWLRVLDSRLPTLATRAAVELDKLSRGGNTDRAAIGELSQLLKNGLEQQPNGDICQEKGSLLDSGTIVILGRALDASQGLTLTKVSQLQELAAKIADQLERVVHNEAHQPLETLRGFCVALAREAAAYHRSLREIRPQHPFEK